MKLWKMLAAVMVLGALVAVACNNDDDDEADSSPTAEGGAETVTVQVDGDGDDFNAYMIQYFPKAVTLHPGDTIQFQQTTGGEPHTVTAGAPVDELVDVIVGYCGPEGFESTKCNEEAPPPPADVDAAFNTAFEALPALLPDGPGDANQTAANPCFLATGTLPADAPCPEVEQPAFKGDEVLYSSGWLGDDPFVVEFADDIAPGTYTFLCLLHGPEMTETVTIVADSADSDTADEADARRDAELGEFQTALAGPAAELQAFAGSDDSGVHVDVQADALGNVPAGVAEFGPDEISIPVGGSVSWLVNGFHTVSFNVPEDAKSLRTVADDGTIHINEQAASPAQVVPPEEPEGDGEGEPPEGEAPAEGEGEPPPEEQGPPPVFDGGSWNGEGFLSTGGIGDVVFKLTFTTAGTYEYKCTVHDGMEGTVKVE